MPELPDIELYLHALDSRIVGRPLEKIRFTSPFLVRSFDPPISTAEGRQIVGLRRLGKQIVFELDDELFLVLHLMIAGRIRWRDRGAKPPGRRGLAAFDFPNGTLILTEAGTKRRAALHLVRGEQALAEYDRGGLEVLTASRDEFEAALTRRRHTLKRALTDPSILSGVGNAYSDEILHRAQLSPFKMSDKLTDAELDRLFEAVRSVLVEWRDRLLDEVGDRFPEKVTAFRPEMAVHGKFREPCPVCKSPVQRIVYAENEANYCATCQTGGRVLADRVLSRLLKDDWPRTLEDLEKRLSDRGG